MKFKSQFGKEYDIKLEVAKYCENGNLAIKMYYFDDEFGSYMPYANLTVNLEGKRDEGCAFVDVNNLGYDVCDWIEMYGLGKWTGRFGRSGFCTYPEYKFDMDAVKRYEC